MWQIILFLCVSLILFTLCLLQDREMDEDLQFLLQYHRIQNVSKETKAEKGSY